MAADDLMAIAKELSRMRLLAQTTEYPRDLAQSYAECLLLQQYGRLPSIVDLRRDSKRKVTLIPKDGRNALIRVVAQNLYPFRVYRSWLHADVLVFIKTAKPVMQSKTLGWLTKDLVTAMPRQALPDSYTADDYCYVIEGGYLIDMPTSFEFVEPEHHVTGDWNGYWNHQAAGWECFSCNRYIPDPYTRAAVARELEDA